MIEQCRQDRALDGKNSNSLESFRFSNNDKSIERKAEFSEIKFDPDLISAIEHAKNVVLVGHVGPDADCIGALISAKDILEGMGKTVTLHLEDGVPRGFRFLESAKGVVTDIDNSKPIDCVVMLDCSTKERAGKAVEKLNDVTLINIDHHLSNNGFGSHNYVGQNSSASEIVYGLAKSLGFDISIFKPESLYAMYKGIMADTRGLSPEIATENAKAICSEIKRMLGSEFVDEHEKIFKEASKLKNEPALMDILRANKTILDIKGEKVAISSLTLAEQEKAELESSDISCIPGKFRWRSRSSIILALELKDHTTQIFVYLKDSKLNALDMVLSISPDKGGGYPSAAGTVLEGIDLSSGKFSLKRQLAQIFKNASSNSSPK